MVVVVVVFVLVVVVMVVGCCNDDGSSVSGRGGSCGSVDGSSYGAESGIGDGSGGSGCDGHGGGGDFCDCILVGVAIVGTISHIKQQTRMDYLLKEMILECVQLSLQPLPSKAAEGC